ncbi:uncharacterized protein C3orf20 homolog [Lemur catta]|uniref:uncharacterized protein C3orf20 homolog n=1 Tax=Lemur catta TaxID=9447 RepID=UPI001E269E16|nr:uncharacterized protein C3orf20 homolog [Lemur catta]
MFPHKVVRKQEVSSANLPLKQGANEKDEEKEYLRYRNTFLELKGVFKPLPLRRTQRTPASNRPFRVPLLMESKDTWFASQLICPAVLRRILCGKEGDICRCSPHSIAEVTDLEYDRLISRQLSSVDQIIIVCVFSAKKDKNINEVAKVYRELNRSRSMPCIQSHLDSFRLLKYNITSASKFTGSNCPLLVQRHNVIPGIFLETWEPGQAQGSQQQTLGTFRPVHCPQLARASSVVYLDPVCNPSVHPAASAFLTLPESDLSHQPTTGKSRPLAKQPPTHLPGTLHCSPRSSQRNLIKHTSD